jgi:hypothetical protein
VFPCHARAQLSTSDHLQEPGFWATKMYSSLEEFADGSAVLREHPELGFDHREYKFRISTANGKSIYSMSNGKEKISALLAWAFGLGHVGQSYLYERDGAWHEARSTYFPAPDVRCKVPGVPCEWKERSGDGKASFGKRVRWRPRNVLHATCRRWKFRKCTMRLPITIFA